MCKLPDRNFLVTLASRDDLDARESFVINSPCICDLEQWVAENASQFTLSNPFVIAVDDKAAHHLPTTAVEHIRAS